MEPPILLSAGAAMLSFVFVVGAIRVNTFFALVKILFNRRYFNEQTRHLVQKNGGDHHFN